MRGEHADERQLDLAQQPGAAAPLEVGLERLGEVEHGAGLTMAAWATCVVDRVVVAVEAELALGRGLGAQLAAEVAQREVAEVEAALARQREVGGERGVLDQPSTGQPWASNASSGPLASCSTLGRVGVGEPAGQRLLVGLGELRRVDGRPRRRRPRRARCR